MTRAERTGRGRHVACHVSGGWRRAVRFEGISLLQTFSARARRRAHRATPPRGHEHGTADAGATGGRLVSRGRRLHRPNTEGSPSRAPLTLHAIAGGGRRAPPRGRCEHGALARAFGTVALVCRTLCWACRGGRPRRTDAPRAGRGRARSVTCTICARAMRRLVRPRVAARGSAAVTPPTPRGAPAASMARGRQRGVSASGRPRPTSAEGRCSTPRSCGSRGLPSPGRGGSPAALARASPAYLRSPSYWCGSANGRHTSRLCARRSCAAWRRCQMRRAAGHDPAALAGGTAHGVAAEPPKRGA